MTRVAVNDRIRKEAISASGQSKDGREREGSGGIIQMLGEPLKSADVGVCYFVVITVVDVIIDASDECTVSL